jgi:hypothetical protein
MKFTCRSAILGLIWLSPVLLAAGSQDVQRDIPRDAKSSNASVLSYPLPLGGALQHAQYAGRLRRVDANGEDMAKAPDRTPNGGPPAGALSIASNVEAKKCRQGWLGRRCAASLLPAAAAR